LFEKIKQITNFNTNLPKLMKKILLFYFCFLFLSAFAFAQNKDVAKIQQILANQTKYWNEGNIEQFMQGYWKNDSLVFMGKNGVTKGYDMTLARYKKTYPDLPSMGKLDFDIKKIEQLSKKVYFVIGKFHLTRVEKGDLQGYFSLIFKKIGKEWVIISDHSS
jgi:hypothetical protein